MPRHRRLLAIPFGLLVALLAVQVPAHSVTPAQGVVNAAAQPPSLRPGSVVIQGRPAAPAGPVGGAVPADADGRLVLPDPDLLSGYVWPLPHGRVTLPFGPTPWGTLVVDGRLFHDGLDIATFCGDRVVAAHDGTVLAAGQHFDEQIGWIGDLRPYFARLDKYRAWGTLANVVIISDGDGYRSIYAHFASVTVHVGQHVTAGQLIGYEGQSGYASGCHVHFGLFSPLETARFGLRPDIVKRVQLPAFEIARIDPLRALPYRTDLGLGPGDPTPPRQRVTQGGLTVSEPF